MSTSFYAVIMAGGGGTRLWPLSRRHQPKQTLKLFDERSLFQVAVERIEPIIPPENIFIVTVAEQAALLQPQAPQIPEDHFILEPEPRGTASVVGLAAAILQAHDSDAVMAVLTADHYIGNTTQFRALLSAAEELAREGDLVTLGIKPDHPETGYGYIQQGESRGIFQGFPAFSVRSFKEKPTRDVAEQYLKSGKYIWNSGMFVWRTDRILEEFKRQMPELNAALDRIRAALIDGPADEVIAKEWEHLVPETIDYGIMEGAQNVSVLPAGELGWLDVGGWGRFFDLYKPDENGNIILGGAPILRDTHDTLVYQSGEGQRKIALLGVDHLVIVDVGDALFICDRDEAERVRDIVKHLKDVNEVALL